MGSQIVFQWEWGTKVSEEKKATKNTNSILRRLNFVNEEEQEDKIFKRYSERRESWSKTELTDSNLWLVRCLSFPKMFAIPAFQRRNHCTLSLWKKEEGLKNKFITYLSATSTQFRRLECESIYFIKLLIKPTRQIT